ncbi:MULTISPECIES: DNA repair protein RadA [unclassified Acinetobacter]|jgi:DNA repair protein RadA/Sms|uniref:DNA repair protein RadA n=1 Tax=Acinetobacter corruptisaponis TaxID=3045147 RepID=A0ABY8S4U3_9GAMM|nr:MULTISPECIES: DNA repair protein RadA [unclassified Acinetobacter]WHP05527.1 DNA repair protein RadA [Acinetobacter sp. KCTC 92772]HEO1806312.1 DNA repair protein RadA [Acinetobacter baumannii]
MAKCIVHICRECGKEEDNWTGHCVKCGAYNSFSKTTVERKPRHRATTGLSHSGYAGQQHHITKLNMVKMSQELRCSTGIDEFDRVLGGGLVTGSVVLIGGDPGIGKSTLLLQTATYIAENQSVLYITGEESLSQVAMRAKRLGLPLDKLDVMAETKVERICEILTEQKTSLVILDSIQTLYTESIPAASGNVSQIKESASILTRFAKHTGISLLIVGHVTKESELAGPRVLEHMVDCVLHFEGQSDLQYRMLRVVKNRFGAVNELSVFDMTDQGLKEVINPATIFLDRYGEAVAGSVVMVSRNGVRPFLVEVQSLVSKTENAPRQLILGLEHNRLTLLLTIMKEQAKVDILKHDVYVNIVGGLKITETASDLAVLLACVSSLKNQPLPHDMAVFGEVGLSGEIRSVPNAQDRIKEAEKNGFKTVVVPKVNQPKQPIGSMKVIAVEYLYQVLQAVFENDALVVN